MANTSLITLPKRWAVAAWRQAYAFATLPKSTLAALLYSAGNARQPPMSNLPEHRLGEIAPREDAFRHMSFTFAIIALSAHVTRAGGKLTPEKYVAFRDAFPLRGMLCLKIRQLFAMACEDPTPFEHYVTQIKYIFPKRTPLFCALVERLFCIACQGGITRDEERLIARIAHGLGVSAPDYTRIRERYVNPPKAHEVLGVAKRAGVRTIKQRYRELMHRYHPDRHMSEPVSPEVALLLRLKTTEINEAYRYLSKRAA